MFRHSSTEVYYEVHRKGAVEAALAKMGHDISEREEQAAGADSVDQCLRCKQHGRVDKNMKKPTWHSTVYIVVVTIFSIVWA